MCDDSDGFCSICGIWGFSLKDLKAKFLSCQSSSCYKSYHRCCLPIKYRHKNSWKICNEIQTEINTNNNISCSTDNRPPKQYFCWGDDSPFCVRIMEQDKYTKRMIERRYILDEDEPMDNMCHLSRKHESCIIKDVLYTIGDDIIIHLPLAFKPKNKSNVKCDQPQYREEICKIHAIDEDFDDRIVILTVYCYWTETALLEELSNKLDLQSYIKTNAREQYKHLALNMRATKVVMNFHLFYDDQYCTTMQGLKSFDIIGKIMIVSTYEEFIAKKQELQQLQQTINHVQRSNILSITDTENSQILDGKYLDVYWCDTVYSYFRQTFEQYEKTENISMVINGIMKENVNNERILFNELNNKEFEKQKRNVSENKKRPKKRKMKSKYKKPEKRRKLNIINNDNNTEWNENDIDFDVQNNNFSSSMIIEQGNKLLESEVSFNDEQKENVVHELNVDVHHKKQGQLLTVEEFAKELETVESMTDSEKQLAIEKCAQFWDKS